MKRVPDPKGRKKGLARSQALEGWELALDPFRLRCEIASRQTGHRVVSGKRLVGGDSRHAVE